MRLNELAIGRQACIIHVGGQESLRRRLLDMGLTPGTIVIVRKKAPFKDPLEISVRSYELVIRKKDAAYIEAEVIDQ